MAASVPQFTGAQTVLESLYAAVGPHAETPARTAADILTQCPTPLARAIETLQQNELLPTEEAPLQELLWIWITQQAEREARMAQGLDQLDGARQQATQISATAPGSDAPSSVTLTAPAIIDSPRITRRPQVLSRIKKMVEADSCNPNDLLDELSLLSPIGGLLTRDAGVSEGYTIAEHTVRVLQMVETFFLPVVDERKGFFRLLMGLHDIGKPRALKPKADDDGKIVLRSVGGDREHSETSQVALPLLREMGFDRKHLDLARELVDHDPFGDAVLDRHPIEQIAEQLHEASVRAHVSVEDFFHLQLCYFIADAGAYTTWVDASPLSPCNETFRFAPEPAQIGFAPIGAERIGALARALGLSIAVPVFSHPVANRFAAQEAGLPQTASPFASPAEASTAWDRLTAADLQPLLPEKMLASLEKKATKLPERSPPAAELPLCVRIVLLAATGSSKPENQLHLSHLGPTSEGPSATQREATQRVQDALALLPPASETSYWGQCLTDDTLAHCAIGQPWPRNEYQVAHTNPAAAERACHKQLAKNAEAGRAVICHLTQPLGHALKPLGGFLADQVVLNPNQPLSIVARVDDPNGEWVYLSLAPQPSTP